MAVINPGSMRSGAEGRQFLAIYNSPPSSADVQRIKGINYSLNPSMYDELWDASSGQLPGLTSNIIMALGDVVPEELAAVAVWRTVRSASDDTLDAEGPRATRELKSWVFTDSEPTPVGDMVVEQDPSEEWLGTLVPAKRRGNIFSMGTQGSPVVALPNPEGKPPFDNVEALITAGGLWVALHRGSSEPGQFFETIVGR